jgi:hypothetical protein
MSSLNVIDAARRPPRKLAPSGNRMFALAVTLLLLAAGAASAGGDLRVDWSTIDAGGGTAAGGNFSLNGTIAQVDADPLQPSSGGNFELTGGFWVIDTAALDPIFRDDFEAP